MAIRDKLWPVLGEMETAHTKLDTITNTLGFVLESFSTELHKEDVPISVKQARTIAFSEMLLFLDSCLIDCRDTLMELEKKAYTALRD